MEGNSTPDWITPLLTGAILVLLGAIGYFSRGKFAELSDRIRESNDRHRETAETFKEDSDRQWKDSENQWTVLRELTKTTTENKARLETHLQHRQRHNDENWPERITKWVQSSNQHGI